MASCRPQAQTWAWDGSGEIRHHVGVPTQPTTPGAALQLQSTLHNPSLATTCPGGNHSSSPCYNLVLGPVGSGLTFKAVPPGPHALSAQQPVKLVVTGSGDDTRDGASARVLTSAAVGLCMAASAPHGGLIANVYLTDCCIAGTWGWNATSGTLKTDAACLDVGSGGSSGDLGYEFRLLPAAVPAQQAFNSSNFTSWGATVIKGDARNSSLAMAEPSAYHMFASVFSQHLGASLHRLCSRLVIVVLASLHRCARVFLFASLHDVVSVRRCALIHSM